MPWGTGAGAVIRTGAGLNPLQNAYNQNIQNQQALANIYQTQQALANIYQTQQPPASVAEKLKAAIKGLSSKPAKRP
jgi:hypothetical protein